MSLPPAVQTRIDERQTFAEWLAQIYDERATFTGTIHVAGGVIRVIEIQRTPQRIVLDTEPAERQD